jgi:hypothetical protein
MKLARPSSTPAPTLGSVRADEVMPAREFRRRLGIGMKAWAVLLRQGFPTIPLGKQKLVDGAAALAYFRRFGSGEGRA